VIEDQQVRSIPAMYDELAKLEHEMLVQLRASVSNDNDLGTLVDKELFCVYFELSQTLSQARARFAMIWNDYDKEHGIYD
jgi:hypothetical protein